MLQMNGEFHDPAALYPGEGFQVPKFGETKWLAGGLEGKKKINYNWESKQDS